MANTISQVFKYFLFIKAIFVQIHSLFVLKDVTFK